LSDGLGHALFYGGGLRIPGLPPPPDVFVDRNYDGKPDLDENSKPIKIVGAGCAFCHSNLGPAHDDGTGPKELYTHQDYHNIGVPFNPEIPVLCPPEGCDPLLQPAPDQGLASHLIEDSSGPIPPGFFKTPTLRNVDKRKGNGFTKAYTHNGWFKSLESIVHFYNTADVTGATATQRYGITRCPLVNDPSYKDNPFYDGDGNGQRPMTEKEALKNNCWPEPQFANSAIPVLVGDLGLEPEDEAAIVAYLKTLTDEETATAPSPYKASKN
jgi:cytochrome c peroxidase